MKSIKKYIGAIALATLALAGCQDDFDAPGLKTPTASLTPNTSIADLKARYWTDDANGIDTIGALNEAGDPVVIAGRVISSDQAGNIYKNLVIQDETGALCLSINANSLYNDYRVGQEIVINATNMYMGKYSGLQQMGFPDYSPSFGWQATFMPLEFFKEHAQLNGLPEPSKVDTITVARFSDITTDAAGLRRWQSQLVRFNNCHFAQGGQTTFTDAYKTTSNRDLVLEDGSTITVRTSGYSNFWGNTLPEGDGDVVGILGYFNNAWQLQLRSASDCMNFGNPTLSPGTEGNPYDVDHVIEMEAAGNESNGWVTGYIVGAVAPAVSEVTGNGDIEFQKDVTMPNTLVIAPTPETKDINSCLVLPLPQGSKLREYGALANHPELYQRQIWVNGTFSKQLGTWGVTTRGGYASEFKIEGVTVDGGQTVEGDGTKEKPYSVTQVLGLGNPGTVSYVTGYIVGWVDGASISEGAHFEVPSTSASNVLIAATPDETSYSKCVAVQLVYNTEIRNKMNLKDNPGNLHKKVVIQGALQAYFGVPGVKAPTDDFTIDGADAPTPDTPDTPSGDVGTGLGTEADPYSVDKAISLKNPGTQSWVTGYIVGFFNGTDYSTAAFTAEGAGLMNVLIAPTATETNAAKCMPVQLGSAVRAAVNLRNNPANLGRKVTIQGTLSEYAGTPGILAASAYKF